MYNDHFSLQILLRIFRLVNAMISNCEGVEITRFTDAMSGRQDPVTVQNHSSTSGPVSVLTRIRAVFSEQADSKGILVFGHDLFSPISYSALVYLLFV